MTKFIASLDMLFQRALAILCVFLFAVMIVAVGGQVVMRYAFNSPLSWSEELARYSMVWLAMLASALCARLGQHIALTDLVRLSPKAKIAANTASVLIVAAVLAVLVDHSWDLTSRTARQTTSGLGISMSYPYAAIPVGSFLMIVGLALGWLDAVLNLPATRGEPAAP